MRPEELTSTLASDAAGGVGVIDPTLVRAVRWGQRVVGPVCTARVAVDDNHEVRRAVARGPVEGTLLVVGGGSRNRSACVGGLLIRELRNAGFTGVITDALVRDSAEIAELGFPVWSRGVTPLRPTNQGGGEVAVPLDLFGVAVRPGDWVIADDDGVVVWPSERVAALLERSSALFEDERERLLAL
jgi:4-hydroxy-4-methyl-2-oxoglutarate aldolase